MQLKHCNHHGGEFIGNETIQERCPVCGDTETVVIHPCPFCNEELEELAPLASINSTLMWCGFCHYFVTAEDAAEEWLDRQGKAK